MIKWIYILEIALLWLLGCLNASEQWWEGKRKERRKSIWTKAKTVKWQKTEYWREMEAQWERTVVELTLKTMNIHCAALLWAVPITIKSSLKLALCIDFLWMKSCRSWGRDMLTPSFNKVRNSDCFITKKEKPQHRERQGGSRTYAEKSFWSSQDLGWGF
jgi:hypothetical protein